MSSKSSATPPCRWRACRNAFTPLPISLNVDVELAHFGAQPMKNGKAFWVDWRCRARGEWPARDFPIGKNISLGKVSARSV